jgi:hypothetical protein
MDHVAGPLHALLAGKKRENLIQYNMSQTLSILDNYLVVLVCLGICFGICPAICPEICLVGKHMKKILISGSLRQAYLLEVGLTQIPVDHAPLSTTCHVGLHVDFLSTNFSWDL